MNWKTFFICGLTGLCMALLFTSLGGLLRGELLLNGHTSIWMFPIYGLAAVIGPCLLYTSAMDLIHGSGAQSPPPAFSSQYLPAPWKSSLCGYSPHCPAV